MNASETERFLMDINAIPRKSFLNEYTVFCTYSCILRDRQLSFTNCELLWTMHFQLIWPFIFESIFFQRKDAFKKNCSALRTWSNPRAISNLSWDIRLKMLLLQCSINYREFSIWEIIMVLRMSLDPNSDRKWFGNRSKSENHQFLVNYLNSTHQ